MSASNLQSFIQTRNVTFDLVQGLSQAHLDHRPGIDKWSIGEVLDHLFLSEQFFCRQMQTLIEQFRVTRRSSLNLSFSDLNVRPAFVPAPLLALCEAPLALTAMFVPRPFIELLLATPLGRARHADAADPRPRLSKEQLLNQLTDSIRETQMIFRENDDLAFDQLRIRHPLLGDNSLVELLAVMDAHERGHQAKVRQSIRHLKSAQRAAAIRKPLV